MRKASVSREGVRPGAISALQEPKWVYMEGGLKPWEDAVVHVDCEGFKRGLSVLEGVKGYWQVDGSFSFVALRAHFDRLKRSARLLYIPFEMEFEAFEAAIFELVGALLEPERDMWARPTLYVYEGHWGLDTSSDLVITAFHQSMSMPEPIRLGVSSWQRSPDVSLPARIKAATNYQVARLARIEGRSRGCDDMVLLNSSGRVAEATGSCILMVRDGVVYTPPASEGALESITVNIVERLAESLDIPFVRRPIGRTELGIADELAICGTLAEIAPVTDVDGLALPDASPILTTLRNRFFDAVRGVDPHPATESTLLPEHYIKAAAPAASL